MHENGDNEGNIIDDEPQSSGESPVVKFVNTLLAHAIERGAEAIHIEPAPGGSGGQIRVREADRTIRRLDCPPGLLPAIMSRLKILAQLDIAERRLAQDGKISVKAAGACVSLRFATFPTATGESGTLVVLRERATPRSLAESDAPAALVAAVKKALSESGLTVAATTDPRRSDDFLGVLASEVDTVGRIAIAVGCESSRLPHGALSATATPQIGATVPAIIRSALRQDPDVLIVGEVRDLETAGLLLDAAEAGASVLARMHVDGAGSSVQRLLDMGVDALRLSESLRLAVCRHAARRQGREAFSYEIVENGPALKRALATRADPVALAQAMSACGLTTFPDQAA